MTIIAAPIALQVTIPPALVMEYCMLSPSICGSLIAAERNNFYRNN